jgi:choline dehydrogenase-like flavoprotein
MAAALEEYHTSRTGPLSMVPVSMAYVPVNRFMRAEELEAITQRLTTSNVTDEYDNRPDRLEAQRRRFTARATELGHVEYVFDLGNWGVACPVDSTGTNKKYASLLQILQYPFSVGSVHIQAPGDLGSPPSLAIDPQYFAGSHGGLDLEVAVRAHRFAERLCSTEPLASLIKEQVWPIPGTTDTDDDLREWLRSVLTTDWHPVGTCGMGGRGGPRGGVVDDRLRVYGVRGLRVVDASIMPLQISAHLQATVYAMAEKAAVMILEDWDIRR